MKRSRPRKKSPKTNPSLHDHQSKGGTPLPPITITDQDLPGFALVLENASERIAEGEKLLRLAAEGMPILTGAELEELKQKCILVENYLASERSATHLILDLYTLAMAHVSCHFAAINPDLREKMKTTQPEYLQYKLQALSPGVVKTYLSIVVLTAKFLRATGTGPV